MGSIPVANPSPLRRPHLSRRALLALALLLALLLIIVITLSFAWPASTTREPARWIDAGPESALAVNQPLRNVEGRFWLVKLETGEILALSQTDPHEGCTVPWRPDFEFAGRKGWFRNPCHGETYDLDGTCVFGPCLRGLDRFEVRTRAGRVQVNVAVLIAGPPPGPQRPSGP